MTANQILRRFTAPAGALLLTGALATGCTTSKQDVREAVEEAERTQRDYVADKTLYTAGELEDRIVDLDARIAEVKGMVEEADGVVAADYRELVNALDQRRDRLGRRAYFLRENANEMAEYALESEWNAVKAEINAINRILETIEEQAQSESDRDAL